MTQNFVAKETPSFERNALFPPPPLLPLPTPTLTWKKGAKTGLPEKIPRYYEQHALEEKEKDKGEKKRRIRSPLLFFFSLS